jgi:hypothetical protein
MVWLKGCPKCKGDLFLDHDSYGKYQSCIQCGFMRDLVDETGEVIMAQRSLPATDDSWMDLLSGIPEAA